MYVEKLRALEVTTHLRSHDITTDLHWAKCALYRTREVLSGWCYFLALMNYQGIFLQTN